MTTSIAIVVGSNGDPSVRQITEKYKPEGSQSLVRVQYSAINPADLRHAYQGLGNSVAGYEWTGTVLEIGENSPFSIGQQLFGMSMPAVNRPLSAGAHQDYLLAEEHMTWAVPPALSPKTAVTLTAAIQTAADAIFNILSFSLPPANLDGSSAKDTPILIWGGSSSVGFAAIQLAKAAGFSPILTTASPMNHSSLKSFGADQCFDYRSPNVIEDVRAAVRESGKVLNTVVDAVSSGLGVFDGSSPDKNSPDLTKSTPSLAHRCCTDPEAKDLRLACVIPVSHEEGWNLCLGVRSPGANTLGFAQDPNWPVRTKQVMDWVVDGYRDKSTDKPVQGLPNINIVHGAEEGIRQMLRVFRGDVSMEKVVIERPL